MNTSHLPIAALGLVVSVAAGLGGPIRADKPAEQLPVAPYASIDRHALLTLPEMEQSLDRLAEHLVKPAANDQEKARALFRWITDRVGYDMDALHTEHPGETRPEAVLRGRKARCFGYAGLFAALARRAGLETTIIPGFCKGVPAADENRPFRPNHAWNAVKIDGRWQFVDATLGAGYVRGQFFRKVFQEQFFMPLPQHLVLTHFPLDPRCQMLPFPLSPQQWDRMPVVDQELFSMGFTLEHMCRQMQTPGFRNFVRVQAQHVSAKVLAAPLQGNLFPGCDYYFLIDAPTAAQLVLVQKDRALPLRKTGTRFEGIIRPEPGELKLNVQRRPQERTMQTMLVYQVNEW